ncbi:hypothetical protein PF008_g4256 [Phytophthora fragariae]|uniref:Uncharacterized protein n=1 Tax=Phytophthora fragariae TaxID=53985 RepID=A0A6G0SBQ7_9STRA|nr:hypothetical protein PF008_g4256 [Phytophthora fragariae]
MPDTESNVPNDEVCSSPSHSSTDDSDSDNSATRVETPSSQCDWLEPTIAAAVDRIMLQVDAAVTAASNRVMWRVGTVIDAAFADFKSVISKKLDDLLAVICDKFQQQNRSLKAKFQEQEQTLDALKAEMLELKKEVRLLLESREGPIDLNVTRSTKRPRSQTNPEPPTTHPRN